MTFGNTTLINFASGELSPKIRGRFDLKLFQNGAERMENFIPETQGPARFRTGTVYSSHTRLNKIARLVEFQFSDAQAYILEFTDLFMRVFVNGGPLVEGDKTITDITQADPGVVTATAHGYSDGDEVYLYDVVGMTEVNGSSYLVANSDANTFELTDIDGNDVDTSGFTAYSSGGVANVVVEVASPYAEADLFTFKVAQNADVMYSVHRSYAPIKITRTGATAFTIATFSRTTDPFTGADKYPGAVAFYEARLAYGGTNDNPETMYMSRAPDSTGTPRYDDFTTGADADHAVIFTLAPESGKVDTIHWMSGTNRFLAVGTFGGIRKITGSRDDLPIAPDSIQNKSIDALGNKNVMPIPSGNTTIYVQRGGLIIRSLEYDVVIDSYLSIDRNLVADHITESGITQIAFQTGRPDILWAVRNDGVLIGLTFKSREDVSGWHRHILGGTDMKVLSVGVLPQDDAFDQVWVVVERTINGATKRYVEYFADTPTYPEQLDYFTSAANESSDITTFQNAVYEKQKEYKHVDSSLTFDGSARGTAAGANVTPAAVTGDSVTFTASASVFTADDVGNEIWKKYVDGVGGGRAVITAYTSGTEVTCRVKKAFDTTDAVSSGNWFLTVSTISGLEHLEGETVYVVTDGAVHPNETVSSGAVSLDYEASIVHIGLGYTGYIKTMGIEAGGDMGASQTKKRNVSEGRIRFLNTVGARFGTSLYNMEQIFFRSTVDYMNRPPILFSGVKRVTFQDKWSKDKHIYIEQVVPLPCVVQLVDIFMETTNE